MIKDIDGFDVKNGETLQSDIFGILPPTRLGGGVKAVLKMINLPESIVYLPNTGR